MAPSLEPDLILGIVFTLKISCPHPQSATEKILEDVIRDASILNIWIRLSPIGSSEQVLSAIWTRLINVITRMSFHESSNVFARPWGPKSSDCAIDRRYFPAKETFSQAEALTHPSSHSGCRGREFWIGGGPT